MNKNKIVHIQACRNDLPIGMPISGGALSARDERPRQDAAVDPSRKFHTVESPQKPANPPTRTTTGLAAILVHKRSTWSPIRRQVE
jgi:hypothetical protein